MKTRLPSIDTYLARQAMNGTHALSKLLQKPEKENGVVHTPREIAQQPLLWLYTERLMRKHAPQLRKFLSKAGLYEKGECPTILFVGAGTSDYVGLSVADLLRTTFGVPTDHCPSTRITVSPESYLRKDRRYIIVHFARSGNSPESSAVLDMALSRYEAGINHIVVTCNPDGVLAQRARQNPDQIYLVLLDEASNDRGLAMTSSYSAMVLAGQALAFLDRMDVFSHRVEAMVKAAERMVETHADALYELASPELERAIFLGNLDLLGAATESALKVQELTAGQVMAASEDTLAFRHGPVSAVNDRTLVCFYLSADPYTRRYELDVIQQYQDAFLELGARTLVVSSEPLDISLSPEIHTVVCDPERKWNIPIFFQVQLAGLVGQLLGLFSSYRRHINVDTPSQDKALYSRTVQGVQIYDYPDGVA